MSNASEILTLRPLDFEELLKRLDNIERSLSNKKTEDEENDILTVDEACRYLKISEPTLYRYIRSLNLPTLKVGNQRRFRKSEINKWTEMQKTI
jgi:excisionase family DNA binding protein